MRSIKCVEKNITNKKNYLKNPRYALLKNEENLTEKQRLKFDRIQQANLKASKAWQAQRKL